MLEFYEFNVVNICIVLISLFVIYTILNKNNKKDEFSIDNLLIASVLSFIISLIVSYLITSKEEELLSENYWDPINISS